MPIILSWLLRQVCLLLIYTSRVLNHVTRASQIDHSDRHWPASAAEMLTCIVCINTSSSWQLYDRLSCNKCFHPYTLVPSGGSWLGIRRRKVAIEDQSDRVEWHGKSPAYGDKEESVGPATKMSSKDHPVPGIQGQGACSSNNSSSSSSSRGQGQQRQHQQHYGKQQLQLLSQIIYAHSIYPFRPDFRIPLRNLVTTSDLSNFQACGVNRPSRVTRCTEMRKYMTI